MDPRPGSTGSGIFSRSGAQRASKSSRDRTSRPDGSLGVDTRRAERDAEAVLRGSFPRLSLGKDLTPKEPGSCEVHTLGEAAETPALAEALRELLARRLPWLDDA